MSDFFDLMLKPFLACLILTGIHAYLGVHVIQRGVIFVDLALAQIAALGSTVGFLCGFGLHTNQGYLVSLLFTILGAAVFALARPRHPLVPQEAIIGICYAVAAAASVIILSRAPEGGEELKALLVGHLLFIDWPEIFKVALIYTLVGFLHLACRKQFFLISESAEKARTQGINLRLWDFIFYASFGFVVTSSVEIAGVLLVFSFLVVPAVCGAFLATKLSVRLISGWAIGFVVSVLGITLSYILDLPTGATVVCVFGLSVPVCALLRYAHAHP